MLDPALVRPGRFDRIIYVGAPDFEGRIEVLKVCARVLAASAISVCPVCRGPGLIKSFPTVWRCLVRTHAMPGCTLSAFNILQAVASRYSTAGLRTSGESCTEPNPSPFICLPCCADLQGACMHLGNPEC